MSDKDSKAPIYIAIVVAVILIAAGGYYVLGGKITPVKTNEVKQTPPVTAAKETSIAPKTTSETTSASAQTPAVTTAPAKVETIKCELCHKDAQDLTPHLNGGKLCVTCHGSQVHNIHIGQGTVGLECNTCHGSPPKIPTVDKSADGPGHFSVCENCHAAPPDSLKPSLGNLVTIHLSRAKYCTNCHGTDIGVIHSASLANATKK
ncbi:MAG TPA: hypothetical protein VKL21_09070 [Candidatus Methanoperedens sp.]|nr:hypothetical protein [Candidatus Methanoperedens sp.]